MINQYNRNGADNICKVLTGKPNLVIGYDNNYNTTFSIMSWRMQQSILVEQNGRGERKGKSDGQVIIVSKAGLVIGSMNWLSWGLQPNWMTNWSTFPSINWCGSSILMKLVLCWMVGLANAVFAQYLFTLGTICQRWEKQKAYSKSSITLMMITCSTVASKAIPSHFQFSTMATSKERMNWFGPIAVHAKCEETSWLWYCQRVTRFLWDEFERGHGWCHIWKISFLSIILLFPDLEDKGRVVDCAQGW